MANGYYFYTTCPRVERFTRIFAFAWSIGQVRRGFCRINCLPPGINSPQGTFLLSAGAVREEARRTSDRIWLSESETG